MSEKRIIQTPSLFKVDETFEDPRFMRVRVASMHSGKNLNNSSFSKDCIEAAKDTFANIPILANIIVTTDENGNQHMDYSSHDMHIENDAFNDGEQRIIYDEKVVGVVPENNNFELIQDEETGNYYAWVDALIYRDYGNYCADILESRGGTTSVSAEISCEQISYDAREKVLNVDEMTMCAITLLGEDVQPGMKNAHATTFDLNDDSRQTQLISVIQELTKALDNYTALFADNNSKEGGTETVFEKLLKKYNKTKEDITFEYEGLSDKELEALFAEHFETKKKKKGADDDSTVVSEGEGEPSGGEGDQNQNANPDQNQNTNTTTDDQNQNQNSNPDQSQNSNPDDNQNSNPDNQTTAGENQNGESEQNQNAESTTGENNGEGQNDNPDGGEGTETFSKTFELSHSDIRSGLYALLAPYEEEDNEWYWITDVYDDHFIYEGWSSEHLYDQKYSRDGDNIKFEGERVHLNVEYLTDSELVALNEMRSNYSQIKSKLASYEAEPEKMAILKSDCYSQISDTEAFKDLMKQETHFEMSVEDVQAKADAMLLEFAKTNKIEFSSKKESEPAKKVGMKMLPVNKKSGGRSRYGGLFAKSE